MIDLVMLPWLLGAALLVLVVTRWRWGVKWKTLAEELHNPKWTGWCSHIAWGAVFVLGAVVARVDHGWALGISIAAGLVWELAWWALSPRRESDRPSVLDWLSWILGACLGWAWVLLMVAAGRAT